MVPKNQGHEGEVLFNLQIQSTQATSQGTQESGHEGEAAVQPENPVHTPVVGSVTETETQSH